MLYLEIGIAMSTIQSTREESALSLSFIYIKVKIEKRHRKSFESNFSELCIHKVILRGKCQLQQVRESSHLRKGRRLNRRIS